MAVKVDYEYDVFLSYPVHSAAGEWVRNHFLPVLKQELQGAAPNPTLFCWTENEVGVIWNERLKRAHARSRIMVAVLTPPYFYESAWCPIEWNTMVEREKREHLGNQLDWSDSLICPVLFSDGQHLPWGARQVTSMDFRNWAVPEPVFKTTAAYIDFRLAVRTLANDIVNKRLPLAPPWSPHWPEMIAPALSPPLAAKPSLADR